MQCAVRLAFAGCFVGLVGACGMREVPSVDVQAIEPRVVEPGTNLWITGAGFPGSGRCSIELEGKTHRPGASSLDVRVRSDAFVQSPQALSAQLPRSAWAQLGAPGTFEGSLRALCPRDERTRTVSAPQPVRFDLVQPLGRGTAHDRALEERARRMLEYAGVEPEGGEPTFYGVVVGSVSDAGPAAQAGLRAGDRIVQADGVDVHALRDLAPGARAGRLELHVYRPELRQQLRLLLDLEPGHRGERMPLERWSSLCGVVLFCALLWRPLRSRMRHWLLMAPGKGSRTAVRMGLWGGRLAEQPVAPGARWLARSLQLACSAAGVLLVCLEPADFLALRSISLYLGFAALSAALMLMNGSGGGSQRLGAAARMLGRMAVLGTLLACACALSGTKALDGLVAEQGGWPWRWSGLQRPALLLAFPFYLAFGSELGAATLALPGPRSAQGWLARSVDSALIAERVITNVALCALAAVVFAGGWQVPLEFAWEGALPRLPGAVLFVAKAWACAGLFAYARNFRWAQRLKPRWTALGCLGTVVLTGLWLWLDPALTHPIERFTARTVCVTLLLCAAWHVLRSVRRAAPRGVPSVQSERSALRPDP